MWYVVRMKISFLAVLALMAAMPVSAGERSLAPRPDTQALKLGFNGEVLRAWYLLLDARGPAEREDDLKEGRLKGPVIVFFQGHAQRPSDAYPFTSKLALGCRSGIVVVPVSDTPYGEDERWRGDRGKEAVLMEVVRHALQVRGIRVAGYSPLCAGEVGAAVIEDDRSAGRDGHPVPADLAAVGWSHGGILARRFAHAYPGSVVSLGQVCPAGFERRGPLVLTGRFLLESMRISTRGTGHTGDKLRSAWGFTRGFVGDFARSVFDAAVHVHPAKLCRTGRDIGDCSLYCGSGSFGVAHVRRVAVLFGADDSCMSPERVLAQDPARGLPDGAVSRFWERHYPDALRAGADLSLEVLPGTHLAPVTHSDLYVDTLLGHLGEKPGPLKEGKGAGES